MAKRSGAFIGEGKDIWAKLELITSHGYARDKVFHDWIDLILNSLLAMPYKMQGEYNDRYLEIIGRYNNDKPKGQRPADYFAEAWGMLFAQTTEKKTDILGNIYEQEITFGEHGQFFTPMHICEAMAQMTGEPKDGDRVSDPCCGSGRMLIASAKLNPRAEFHGKDLDQRCAKMCVINFWLFGMVGYVEWGNSLTFDWERRWAIDHSGMVFEYINDHQSDSPPVAVSAPVSPQIDKSGLTQPSLL